MKGQGTFNRIQHPEQEDFSCLGGDDLTIIIHNDRNKRKLFFPVWTSSENGDETLTLDSIRKQVEDKYGKSLIVVMAESPLDGCVYRYSSYGDFWVQIGTLCGYA